MTASASTTEGASSPDASEEGVSIPTECYRGRPPRNAVFRAAVGRTYAREFSKRFDAGKRAFICTATITDAMKRDIAPPALESLDTIAGLEAWDGVLDAFSDKLGRIAVVTGVLTSLYVLWTERASLLTPREVAFAAAIPFIAWLILPRSTMRQILDYYIRLRDAMWYLIYVAIAVAVWRNNAVAADSWLTIGYRSAYLGILVYLIFHGVIHVPREVGRRVLWRYKGRRHPAEEVTETLISILEEMDRRPHERNAVIGWKRSVVASIEHLAMTLERDLFAGLRRAYGTEDVKFGEYLEARVAGVRAWKIKVMMAGTRGMSDVASVVGTHLVHAAQGEWAEFDEAPAATPRRKLVARLVAWAKRLIIAFGPLFALMVLQAQAGNMDEETASSIIDSFLPFAVVWTAVAVLSFVDPEGTKAQLGRTKTGQGMTN